METPPAPSPDKSGSKDWKEGDDNWLFSFSNIQGGRECCLIYILVKSEIIAYCQIFTFGG
jgi:hypothetical protein